MKEDTKKSTNVIKGPWTLTETMKKRAANASTDWAKKEELSINGLTNEVDIITGVIENIEDGNIDSAIDDLYQLKSYKEAS